MLKQKRLAFTLMELAVSVGLLIVAISIALFATVGSSSTIQKADARSSVAEGARNISDTLRRTVVNAPVGAVSYIGAVNTADSTYSGIRVKAYSQDQGETVCYVIGRAIATSPNGQEIYTFSPAGDTVAYWIYDVDTSGLCPEITSPSAYQNRLNDRQTLITDFRTYVTTYTCLPSCTKQQLRYWATIKQLRKNSVGSTAEARQPSVSFESSIAVGLINESIHLLTVDTMVLGPGTVNRPYNQTLSASGGYPPYHWILDHGTTLPLGLSLSDSGSITGTPTTAITKSFEVKVTDSAVPTPGTASRSLSITINALAQALIILPPYRLSPGATELVSYSYQLQASGGSGVYLWHFTSNPTWLAITQGGNISGTPPDGSSPSSGFTVIAADASDPSNSTAVAITLPIEPGGSNVSITSNSPLPPGIIAPYAAYSFAASGGSGSYIWTLDSGSLPTGLALSSGGILNGAPTCAPATSYPATYAPVIRVKDANDLTNTTTKPFSIVISDPLNSCGDIEI